jgi:hypothetical protein
MFNKKLFWLSSLVLAVFMLTSSITVVDSLAQSRSRSSRSSAASNKIGAVPRGTQMKIRLDSLIDSQKAKEGDRFQATAITPSKYADASIDGHLTRVQQSGKVKGQTSLVLVFDSIRLTNGETYPLRGDVTKIYGEKSVKEVDEEGNIKSSSRGDSTTKRTVGGAAAGAILGGIIGGGKGAAIGAGIGAAGGAGSNVIRGSNQIKLDEGTEILVRTR